MSDRSDRTGVKELLGILSAQDYRCALSGHPLTPANASADHIVPLCRGGTHAPDNAQIVTREINRAKGTMTNEEFINLCRLVVEHAERHKSDREASRGDS
jgi:5-methylcytosine-specific restriction endonuclease McrA